jgi:hypothetical protein
VRFVTKRNALFSTVGMIYRRVRAGSSATICLEDFRAHFHGQAQVEETLEKLANQE